MQNDTTTILENEQARFEVLVARLWETRLTELPAVVENLSMNDRRTLSQHFEGLAANAARIATYLDFRGGCGYDRGHEAAVKVQNGNARQVRRVFGYNNTPDIHF